MYPTAAVNVVNEVYFYPATGGRQRSYIKYEWIIIIIVL